MSGRRNSGNVLIECLIALLCLLAMSSCVAVLCRLQKAGYGLQDMEDTWMMKTEWESEGRCRIYCPKEDPTVDITF
ncbi:MAG: hypothetical protein IJM79_05895 [Erysipelotrichaceae bacterium]|nr:hypothetical protein [Erysipelotrichaceae bacterium]